MLALLATLALAGGDGLYDPAPPADGAFVRFAATAVAHGETKVDARAVGPLAEAQVGPYVVAKAGPHDLALGELHQRFEVAAGHFYTVVPHEGALVVVEDQTNTNLAKASLALYNLTERPSIALKTADGNTPILADVAPSKAAFRAVNPIRVDLGIFDGTTSLSTLAPLSMAQGQGYSVFALPDGDGVKALVVQSTTDTTR